MSQNIRILVKNINEIYKIEVNDEVRVIERCHFNNCSNGLIPTSYWYKRIDVGNRLSKRKKDIADLKFTDDYMLLEKEEEHVFKDYSLMTNIRIAIKEGSSVGDYFCARNKKAMKAIQRFLKEKVNTEFYELYELIISSAINLIKLSDKKASSRYPIGDRKKT